MPDGNVFRRESKRWVAPKTSYDGEDWGNDYDEYDGYGEIAEESETEQEPPVAARRLPGSKVPNKIAVVNKTHEETKNSSDLPAVPVADLNSEAQSFDDHSLQDGDKESINDESLKDKSLKDGSLKSESLKDGSLKDGSLKDGSLKDGSFKSLKDDSLKDESLKDESHVTPETSQPSDIGNLGTSPTEDEDSSIQDIYGFYENRYSQHPYSAMTSSNANGLPSDFSDSTASLSTGIYSVDSAAITERGHDNRMSADYQSDLNKVPEAIAETPTDSHKDAELPSQVAHLHIKKHSRNASLETTTGSGSMDESISSTPKPDLSKLITSNENKAQSSRLTGPSGDTSLGDTSRYSQLVDPDIAELYMGSSELLTRPISTYQASNLHTRDISDKSIRGILTPTLETSEFETPEDATTHIPSLLVTFASPDQPYEDEVEASEPVSIDGDATAGSEKESSDVNSYKHPSAMYDGYVDGPSGIDAGNDSGSDEESEDETDESEEEGDNKAESSDHYNELFVLPSERNRLQQAASSTSIDGAKDDYSSHVPNDTYSDNASEATSDVARLSDQPETDTLSEIHKISSRKEAHARGSSEMSADSSATGVTTSSNSEFKDLASITNTSETGSADIQSTADSGDKTSADLGEESRGNATETAKAVHPIAAKVKRLPQVDFAALFGHTDLSSEARNKQIQQLRIREVEYSTGLETWLMATLDNIDKNAQVHTNGIPPSGDMHALELPATAKMSNVVHTSATNTKEKLGKVGTKSKSFFAKVIR